MSQDDARNEGNLRHFVSRSRQPKLLAGGSIAKTGLPPVTSNYIAYEQSFGSVTDQLDGTKFKYIGTTPGNVERLRGDRHMKQEFMRQSFR